jgi:hypothetical protein
VMLSCFALGAAAAALTSVQYLTSAARAAL